MRLLGKSVIVTGGGNGIGRHYVVSLCSQGARVLVADIDGDAAKATAAGLNDTLGREAAAACTVDVTSEEDTLRMAETAIERFGQIDVLVNNAGSYPHVDFADIDYAAWRKVMAVNLDSVFLCTKAVLPQMRAQGSGKIINVTTNLVWVGLSGMVHYIAAKSGNVGFTRALAREVGVDGITVNSLAPGAVIPEAWRNASGKERIDQIVAYQAVKRPQEEEDLTGTLVFLASSDSDFISGQVITVDGGLTMH